MWIDSHTHRQTDSSEITEVIISDIDNYHLPHEYKCLGIHPWNLQNEFRPELIKELESYLEKEMPWALGECGLDKMIEVDLKVQTEYFQKQLELAKHYKIPRIVIHCVKAYNETYHVLKKVDYRGLIIMHDFNANTQVAEQFLREFNPYFSFGAKLFNHQTTAAKTLAQLPLDRILFETDDQAKYSISEIYQQASILLKQDLTELKESIMRNFFILNHSSF